MFIDTLTYSLKTTSWWQGAVGWSHGGGGGRYACPVNQSNVVISNILISKNVIKLQR